MPRNVSDTSASYQRNDAWRAVKSHWLRYAERWYVSVKPSVEGFRWHECPPLIQSGISSIFLFRALRIHVAYLAAFLSSLSWLYQINKGEYQIKLPGALVSTCWKSQVRVQVSNIFREIYLLFVSPRTNALPRIPILKIISFSYGNRESKRILRTYIARTCLPKEFQGSRILSKGFCFLDSRTRTYIFIYIRTACRGSIVLYSRRKQKADNDEKRIGMPHSPRN